MANISLRKTFLHIIVALVAVCITFGGFVYYMDNGKRNKPSENKHVLSPDLKKCSITTTFKDFRGEKHRRSDFKINDAGEYQQLCGLTTISPCAELSELKYLETFIKNSKMLRKVISPLPYTSYHMTTYTIYTNSKLYKPKFVQNWLDEDKTRKVSPTECIPTADVYPILSRAQTIWDDTKSEQFTVTTKCLHLGTALKILVKMDDANVEKEFVNAQMQCDKNIFYKTTKVAPLHITLGYIFADFENLSSEEMSEFKQEVIELERKLPKTVIMKKPKVSSFSDMKKFIAIAS